MISWFCHNILQLGNEQEWYQTLKTFDCLDQYMESNNEYTRVERPNPTKPAMVVSMPPKCRSKLVFVFSLVDTFNIKVNINQVVRKACFRIVNEIEGQCQTCPKFTGISTVLRCIFGPNLEIPSWIGGELSYEAAQNVVNVEFYVKLDLEGQDQSTSKTKRILTKVFCIFYHNLMALTWIGDGLLHRKARGWHMQVHTYTHWDQTGLRLKWCWLEGFVTIKDLFD